MPLSNALVKQRGMMRATGQDFVVTFVTRSLFISMWLGLLAIAVPYIPLILALSIVGIPVALLMAFAPAAFLLQLLFLGPYIVLPGNQAIRVICATFVAVALLAIPPLLLNRQIEAQAQAWTATDHNDLQLPLNVRSIGIKKAYVYPAKTTQCDAFCLHALLSGSVERFLVSPSQQTALQPQPAERALEYSIRRMSSCPPVNFQGGGGMLDLVEERQAARSVANTVELMKLKMAEGECLVERKSRLDDADIVITQGQIKRGMTAIETGFDFDADTISVSRLAVHRLGQDGLFREIYRQTFVQYLPFGPLYIPFVASSGANFKWGFGWLRTSKKRSNEQQDMQHSWLPFLTQTLGLDLVLDRSGAGNKIIQKVEESRIAGNGPTRAQWDTFSDYIDRQLLGRASDINPEIYDLITNILRDPKFPPPPGLHKLVRHLEDNGSEEQINDVAAILMQRAMAGVTWSQSLEFNSHRSLAELSSGISQLPENTLKPYMNELVALAHNPTAQVSAYSALQKLSAFGNATAETMLYLMQTGMKGGETFFRYSQYQHPYLAGLIGLCQAGSDANSALPQLQSWLQKNQLPVHASYGPLTVTTLVRLGGNPDQLWEIYSAHREKADRKSFDRIVARSNGPKRKCRY